MPGPEDYEVRSLAAPPEVCYLNPSGLALDAVGNLYAADTGNHIIRLVRPGGDVVTVAGLRGDAGFKDGIGSAARFTSPTSVAIEAGGDLLVSDFHNNRLRRITAYGEVSTLATTVFSCYTLAPAPQGTVYLADGHRIARLRADGSRENFVGGLNSGDADGVGESAQFGPGIQGLVFDAQGNLYVADTGNNTIRRVTPARYVKTLAGEAGVGGHADGVGATARFSTPRGLALDPWGNVLVAAAGNQSVRRMTPRGLVVTLAGSSGETDIRDGPAKEARFYYPSAVASDAAGNVYVADQIGSNLRVMVLRGDGQQPIRLRPVQLGTPLTLDIAPYLAEYWEWTVTKRPGGSAAQLSSPLAPRPSFTPDVEGLYEFEVKTYYASDRTCTQRAVLNVGPTIAHDPSALRLGSPFAVHLATLAGKRYALEYKDSLCEVQWQPLPWVLADGTVMKLTDPGPTVSQRFYRVRWED